MPIKDRKVVGIVTGVLTDKDDNELCHLIASATPNSGFGADIIGAPLNDAAKEAAIQYIKDAQAQAQAADANN